MSNAFRLAAVAVSLSLLSGIASADRYPEADYPVVQVKTSTVTRAETLAELQIWRESGLADFDRLDGVGAETLPGYAVAVARYEFLKTSERFAELKSHFSSSTAQPPRLMVDLTAVAPKKSTLTRAEVRAKLEAWRDAGLAAFESSESGSYRSEAEYQAAKARYAHLLQLRGLANASAASRQG